MNNLKKNPSYQDMIDNEFNYDNFMHKSEEENLKLGKTIQKCLLQSGFVLLKMLTEEEAYKFKLQTNKIKADIIRRNSKGSKTVTEVFDEYVRKNDGKEIWYNYNNIFIY